MLGIHIFWQNESGTRIIAIDNVHTPHTVLSQTTSVQGSIIALEIFSLLAYILLLEDPTRCLTKGIDCYFFKNVSAMYLVTTISSSTVVLQLIIMIIIIINTSKQFKVPELYNGTCYRLNKQLRSATPFLTCVLTHLSSCRDIAQIRTGGQAVYRSVFLHLQTARIMVSKHSTLLITRGG
jgi:hypothetical protein